MMKAYAIINTATKLVENRVDYETAPNNPPPGFPAGYIAVQSDMADTTWVWDGTNLIAPKQLPPIGV